MHKCNIWLWLISHHSLTNTYSTRYFPLISDRPLQDQLPSPADSPWPSTQPCINKLHMRNIHTENKDRQSVIGLGFHCDSNCKIHSGYSVFFFFVLFFLCGDYYYNPYWGMVVCCLLVETLCKSFAGYCICLAAITNLYHNRNLNWHTVQSNRQLFCILTSI